MGGAAMPKMHVCYICGRQFGSTSLAIHEKSCLKKWEIENEQQEPHLRRRPPVKPDPSLKGQAASDAAYESYTAHMVPCEICGRTFSGVDRMQIHLKSCMRSSSPPKSTRSRSDDAAGAFPSPRVVGLRASNLVQGVGPLYHGVIPEVD